MPENLYLSGFRRVAFHKRYALFHKRYALFHKRYASFHKRYANYRAFSGWKGKAFPVFSKGAHFSTKGTHFRTKVRKRAYFSLLSHQERKEEARLKPPLCPEFRSPPVRMVGGGSLSC